MTHELDGAPQPARATVLIVEDDVSLSTTLWRNLTARGYRVVQAWSVGQAIAAIQAERPALMLLDVNLPDASGWDVLRALSADGQHVPTVMLSAVPVSRARRGEFRPEACFPKPFPLDALLATIERLTQTAPVHT